MKRLSDNDLILLEQICKLNQAMLWKTMNSFLKKNYKKVTCTKDYIYAEGEIPVALVAHLDTVFPSPPKDIYYDTRKGVIWSPQGLGADDRAGVFSILKIIKSGLRPHVIFTTDEERGGLGANQLTIMEPKMPFKNLKYIIELDRRGTNDCVFYECDNDEFTKYIESFGFVEAIGSFSDIGELCPAWGIAGVNLSVGYENEHSYSEILCVNPLLSTIQKVKQLLTDAANVEVFDYVPSKFALNGAYYQWYNSIYGTNLNDDYDDVSFVAVTCNTCGKTFSEYEVIPVQCANGQLKFYCPDCLTMDKVDWCSECGEAYEKNTKNTYNTLCYDCKLEKQLKKGRTNHPWTTSNNNSPKSYSTPKTSTSPSTSTSYSTYGVKTNNGSSTKTMDNLSSNIQNQ